MVVGYITCFIQLQVKQFPHLVIQTLHLITLQEQQRSKLPVSTLERNSAISACEKGLNSWMGDASVIKEHIFLPQSESYHIVLKLKLRLMIYSAHLPFFWAWVVNQYIIFIMRSNITWHACDMVVAASQPWLSSYCVHKLHALDAHSEILKTINGVATGDSKSSAHCSFNLPCRTCMARRLASLPNLLLNCVWIWMYLYIYVYSYKETCDFWSVMLDQGRKSFWKVTPRDQGWCCFFMFFGWTFGCVKMSKKSRYRC